MIEDELFKELANSESLAAVGSAKSFDPPEMGDEFVAYYIDVLGEPERVEYEVKQVEVFEEEWEGTLIDITDTFQDE